MAKVTYNLDILRSIAQELGVDTKVWSYSERVEDNCTVGYVDINNQVWLTLTDTRASLNTIFFGQTRILCRADLADPDCISKLKKTKRKFILIFIYDVIVSLMGIRIPLWAAIVIAVCMSLWVVGHR